MDEGGATGVAMDEGGATGGATAIANDCPEDSDEGATANDCPEDSDDEVEVTFSLPYEEVSGKRKDSKGFFYTPDNHLYRVTRKLSDTQNFVYCYHSRKTADSNIEIKCLARGVMELTTKRITLKKDHDHLPDIELLHSLQRRSEVLQEAEASNVKLYEVFKNALRGKEGACAVSYPAIERSALYLISYFNYSVVTLLSTKWLTHFRTMRPRRRGKTPASPQNAIDADKFLRDEMYRDTIYAKYYIGFPFRHASYQVHLLSKCNELIRCLKI